MTITHSELLEKLSYIPETGVFTWLISSGKAVKGSRAGKVSKDGYRIIGIRGKYYKASRLAWFYMTGEWPEKTVDHWNRARGDDSWANLRLATRMEQNINRSKMKNNVSGTTGVYFYNKTKRWVAKIVRYGKLTRLGSYVKLEDAVAARLKAEKELSGVWRAE